MTLSKKIQKNQALMSQYWRLYQLILLRDKSRFRIIRKSRQIGISECIIYEAISECVERDYHNVYLASMSLREAKELIRRAAFWLQVILPAITGKPCTTICQKTTLEFANGSRIEALPAEKIRSRSGSIYLDEFAFMKRPDAVWAAIAPATEAKKDLKITIISTPLGDKGMFFDIWKSASESKGVWKDWSPHFIDVYRAANDGFPVDPEDLKERYPSDIFAQEFEAKFISDQNQFFSNDLLRSCLYDDLPDIDYTAFGGLDLAESVDASVFSQLREYKDKFLLPPNLIKEAGDQRDFSDQEVDIFDILDNNPFRKVAVDAAGNGSSTAQNLFKKYPQAIRKIKSGHWKKVYERIPYMRDDMEKKKLYLPNDRHLLRDFRAIQRKTLTNHRVTYEATRNQHGHADSFYSSLLAYEASMTPESSNSKVKSRTRTHRARGISL